MNWLLPALIVYVVRLALALGTGYLITVWFFPLAFESLYGGLELVGIFSILSAICFPFTLKGRS